MKVIGSLGTIRKGFQKNKKQKIKQKQKQKTKTGPTRNQRKNRDHPDLCVVKDQLEYSEESWRPKETHCYSDSSERLPSKTDVKKNSLGVK